MDTLTLTTEQKEITTQKGSIYVKFSSYYTATVRNLSDLVRLLNDDCQSKECLEIVEGSEWNVSNDFVQAVRALIAEFKCENVKKINAKNVKNIRVVNQNDKEYYMGDNNKLETYTVGVEINGIEIEQAELIFEKLCEYIEDKDTKIVDHCTPLLCPTIYDMDNIRDNEFYDSISIPSTYYTKKEFMKDFRACVRNFKKTFK